MGTDVGNSSSDIQVNEDSDLKSLEQDFKELQDEAQRLLSERVHLENDLANIKKRASRLDEEVRILKSPPLIIGHLQDVLDDERAIVRSSNGTVFQVSINQRLDPTKLKPGTRIALNQDTLSIIEILHDAWDPMVSGAELLEKPTTTYESVGGLDEEILQMREANHTNASFIRMVGSELAQKYIGEGGRMVRELFSLAKEKSPSIIFLDEIDAIGAKRLDSATSGDREVQRTLMQLLAELDGFDSLEDVKIIAATNRPDILDDALLRPGRFDRIIVIPLPDEVGRKKILSIHFEKMSTSRVNIAKIVELTEGFSGAELKATTVESGMIAIRENRSKVKQEDVLMAVDRIKKKRESNGRSASPDALYG